MRFSLFVMVMSVVIEPFSRAMESRKESMKICIVPVSMSSLGFSCLGFLTGRKTEDIFFFWI